MPTTTPTLTGRCSTNAKIDSLVAERISTCPYAHHFNKITWHVCETTLTLRGSVATFHMKQVLQSILQDIQEVEKLANEVDVVSATGLSSERKL